MRKVTMMIVGIYLCTLFTSCASDKMVKQGEMDAKKQLTVPLLRVISGL